MRRTTSSVRGLVEGLDIYTLFNYCFCALHTYQHMLCIVAIVDCTLVGSAIAAFTDLVMLHRRTLQRIFWQRISNVQYLKHYGGMDRSYCP